MGVIQTEISRRLTLAAVVLMFAAAAIMGEVWASPATISIGPGSVNDVPVGETFTVDVIITDVTNLYGWLINVTFNPNILKAEEVLEGPFLKNVNDTVWPKPVLENSKGYVFASASLLPPYPPVGVSGSGTLGNITFTVKSSGSSTLHFDETMTYLRTFDVSGGVVVPIEGVVKQDGTYGRGGGGGIEGIPFELIVGGVAVVVVVAVVAGVIFLRRRR